MRSGNWSSSHWKGRIVVLVLVEESGQPRLRLVHDVRMGDRSKRRISAGAGICSLGGFCSLYFSPDLFSVQSSLKDCSHWLDRELPEAIHVRINCD